VGPRGVKPTSDLVVIGVHAGGTKLLPFDAVFEPLLGLLQRDRSDNDRQDHLLNGTIDVFVLTNRAQLIATLLKKRNQQEQSGSFVAIDEAVIARHRLNERCRLAMDGTVVARIGTADRGFYEVETCNARMTTELQRPFVGAESIGDRQAIMLLTYRRAA